VGNPILEFPVITANPSRILRGLLTQKLFCEALITAGATFYHQLLRGNNETAAGRF